MEGSTYPVAAIASDLRSLGLGPGDLVMVHASLRAIGPVEGGADGVIDAVQAAIGATGTMLMVLGARDDHAWVNERSEPEREALLEGAQPFDAQATPASPDVGTLAEVFRVRPETHVSDHPEGRFAAAGPMAAELLTDVPWDDYFGPGSPLGQLIEQGGKVLRMGADPETVTALHHAEYLAAVTPKRRVRRHRLVATPDGPVIKVVECLDDEEGIVDYDGDDYFADILRAYLATGRARAGTVGDARSELIEAADIVAFGVRWMDEHLARAAPKPVSITALMDRLDSDLLAARRQRSAPQIAAIRAIKTALSNAEAVPVAERPYELVEGSADVPRRTLGQREMASVIEMEVVERQRAIAEYQGVGADTAALESELATLERYRALL